MPEIAGKHHVIAGSLVLTAFLCASIDGSAADESIEKAVVRETGRSPGSLNAAVARGDAQAMYQVAMLHIEGTITDADYDYGVFLLKKSAAKGNEDAQRMYSFMDNAFSGDGC